ncbi:MAG: hypothetical protein EHM55_00405 [Acidobacteria bacterium]|nr:MAG: hypothetical protein EHM55_00405 [Acidobacteriota bacterium]
MTEPVESAANSPRSRRIRRILTILAVSVGVLAAAAYLLLHLSPGRRFVQSQVTELLRQQRIDFEATDLSYNLAGLSVSMRNLEIRSREAPDLPPFARVGRVTVDLAVIPLLRGRYVLQSGHAEGVSIHYVTDEAGRDNVPRPPSDPDRPSEPLDYLVEELVVTRGTVRYEQRAEDIDASIAVSAVEVHGSAATDRHSVRLAAGPGNISMENRRVTIEALTAVLDAGDDDVRFEEVNLTGEGTRAELSGTISNFGDPSLDLDVTGVVDAARASTLADIDEPVGGTVEIDATVDGAVRSPTIAGRIEGSELRFRALINAELAAAAVYDMAHQRVTISSLRLQGPAGQIAAEGTVELTDNGISRLDVSIANLRTADVMRALDLPYVVASKIDARADARWPGLEYQRATGEGAATFAPTASRASEAMIPLGGRIDVKGHGDTIDAVLTDISTGSAGIDGRVRIVDRSQLSGHAQVAIDDVARTVATAEAMLGRSTDALLPVRVAGALTGTARLGGTVAFPRVTAQVSSSSLTLGRASAIVLDADVAYSPARVTLRHLQARWRDADIAAAGTIALQGDERMNLTASAESLQVSELLRAADQSDVPASGMLSLQGRIIGTAARPAASFGVNGSDLTAYGENWGALDATVNFADRQLVVADMTLVKPQPVGDGRISGTGTLHLDRRTYTIRLQSENLQLVDLTLPNGRELRGDVQFTARADGSVERPVGTVRLTSGGLRLDQYDLGSLSIEAAVADQMAAITARAPRFAATADARIDVEAPYPATGEVRIDNLQLEALPIELQTSLEGRLAATVTAKGTLESPKEGAATVQLHAVSGTWRGQPFSLDAPARLGYARERLTIDRLQLVARDSTVEISGELPLTERGAPGAIDLDARANLATLAEYAPDGTELTGSGTLLLTGVVRGTLEAIDPTLTVTIENGGLSSPETSPGLSNLNLAARVEHGIMSIEKLDANFGAADIAAAGVIPLDVLPEWPIAVPRPGGAANVAASIQGLELSEVPGIPDGVGGRISFGAQLAADRADLAAIDGRVTFDELQVAFNDLTLAQEDRSTIVLTDGSARIEPLTLSGSVGTLTAAGTAALTRKGALDIDVEGDLNVAAVSAFTDVVRAEGQTALKIAARGTVDSPDVNGYVDLRHATFVVDEPLIAAENVDARLELSGRRVTLAQLTGAINGGSLTGSGFVELGQGGIADAALEVGAEDVANDFPLDLRSLSDINLRLSKSGANEFAVDGKVTIDEAGLTGDINFDEGLLAAMTSRRRLDLTESRNPFLERLRFNVSVETATPILVENNLARAEVTADLRVLGTPYEPGLAGRLTVLDGGEIALNERRYEVERGVITFVGERELIPSLDLQLYTTARNYDVTLAVSGTPGDTDTSLTSVPELPEPDIMALLVTGRTLEEMRGEEFEVAREQVLSYLAGRVGSQLGRGIERATGLSTVRIEPNLIASEADPGARLTVGQEVTRDLELIYSVDLTDSNDQIWVAEYDITRRFQTNLTRQNDDSYRFDFRHDVRFGGRPGPGRMPRRRPTVSDVSIQHNGVIAESALRALFGVDAGDELDFFAARDGVESVREALMAGRRLQSRVRLQRKPSGGSVSLHLAIDTGPEVEVTVEGATVPPEIIDGLRRQWQRGVFDAQRIDDGVELLRRWLMREQYLQAEVIGTVDDAGPDLRRARFVVEPSTRFDTVVLAFEGASGIDAGVLDDIIEQQDLEMQLFTDPVQVTELLERYYGEQGYLVAEVDAPKYEFDGTIARVVLAITEGPRFLIRDLSTSGNGVMPSSALVDELPLSVGDPFLPFAAERGLQLLRNQYWQRGYNEVRIDYEVRLDRAAGAVDVVYEIDEGARSVIAGISVEGNEQTSDRLVREQVELHPEEALDLKALARSRSNLYATRAFSLADITRDEQPSENGEKPVRLNVTVREVQPIQLRYGLSFDTERGVGGIVDLSNHNTLGKARVIGVRSRYDAQVREARTYFNQPALRYWPVATTASVYYRDERNPATEKTGRFDIDRRGASLQQERELANSYVWSYGVRYERARTIAALPGGVDERVTVTPLSSTFIRETRDEVLDATRGSFTSQGVEYSPAWLGADNAYLKYFGQYFRYFPLQAERRERFTGEPRRPRLVYAAGVRLGLARAFGGVVPFSERFFAGGSATLRGFEQNAVGPVGADGLPLGGEAMLAINNELRFPLVSIFDGVTFVDVGNVFRTASDFSFADLRKSGGVGLRVRTPWFLGRVDYGIPLDRRAGERTSRVYFSIGQAF